MTVNPSEGQVQTQEAAKIDNKEHNFAQLRKQLEAERAARQQSEERLANLERQAQERTKPKVQDDDDDASDEPYIDRKALKKSLERERERVKQEAKEEVMQETRKILHEERKNDFLRSNPDFNEIMSPEVLQRFADKHPGIAEGILSMPDSFERQKLVYRTVKDLGVNKKEEPKTDIQQKVDRNMRNPYYQPSSVGTAPYQGFVVGGKDYSPAEGKTAYAKMQELKSKLRI